MKSKIFLALLVLFSLLVAADPKIEGPTLNDLTPAKTPATPAPSQPTVTQPSTGPVVSVGNPFGPSTFVSTNCDSITGCMTQIDQMLLSGIFK